MNAQFPQEGKKAQPAEIVSRGRIFERFFGGKIHYYQNVFVLDGYAESARPGAEGSVSISHKTEIEIEPPSNPNSY